MKISILALLVLVVFSGCSNNQEQGTIKIVTSAPMQVTNVGQDIVKGVELALEESGYEISGYKIELIVEDDGDDSGQWQSDIEVDIASRAVADEDVMIYIGTFNSGAAKYSIPINNKGGLVQISPANTWPGLTQAGFVPGEPGIFYPTGMRNFFRVCPTDAVQGPSGAIWAKDLGFHNIYIFDDGEAYGKGIADLFEQKANELGLNVVGHETLDRDSDDYSAELDELRSIDLDLIYFGGTTSTGAIPLIEGIRKLDGEVQFMGPDAIMDKAFIKLGGDSTEGVYTTVVGIPASRLTGKGEQFYDAYKDRFDEEPGAFSGFGYEAAKVSLLAIDRAGINDRQKILDEVSKIKDYDGIFGTWSFDQNGDTTLKIVSGNRVQDGEFVFMKTLVN